MKEINMYIRGICKNTEDSKEGRYIVLVEYKGRFKQITGKENNTTSNRMLITAFIKGVELLKEPCIINLYTPTLLGFKSVKGSPNKDLLKNAVEIIEENGHSLNENVSREQQNYLTKVLRRI